MGALVKLLAIRRDAALGNLRRARGEVELVRYQTLYNQAQETIDTIEKAPLLGAKLAAQ